MFFDPRTVPIFLYRKPIDCRKSHNGLIFLVTEELRLVFSSGALFIFFSRDRKTAKGVKWDGTGAIIYHKKLERGRIMPLCQDGEVLRPTAEELAAFLAGAHVRFDLTL